MSDAELDEVQREVRRINKTAAMKRTVLAIPVSFRKEWKDASSDKVWRTRFCWFRKLRSLTECACPSYLCPQPRNLFYHRREAHPHPLAPIPTPTTPSTSNSTNTSKEPTTAAAAPPPHNQHHRHHRPSMWN